MYLSAERMAVANRTVQETFEYTSVVWQAIPHWDTGDLGQARVRNDVTSATGPGPLGAGSLELEPMAVSFEVTLAQASAPTPDALLAAVMSRTVELAQKVDTAVLTGLLKSEKETSNKDSDLVQRVLNTLIDARQDIEDVGYRAPSCLITSTEGVKALSQLAKGVTVDTERVLAAANVNSMHRATQLNEPNGASGTDKQIRLLMLGRRQRIAHGCAAAASPGEEPVDLAVSVPPSLEVVGETADGTVELAVRIRFATRIKDVHGVVAVVVTHHV